MVGRLAKYKGYKDAIAYVNGNEQMSIGGGVCQVSTAIYQCAKKSGMKIIERHEHGKAVSYIKDGEDATVTYGLRNLIFKNTCKYPIKIVCYSYDSTTVCRFYKIIED